MRLAESIMVSEESIFVSENVVVTRTLAKFDDVTYPINGIGAVFVKAPTFEKGVLVFLLGCALGFGGLVFLTINTWVSMFCFIGVSCSIVGSFILPIQLMLRTGSGDKVAFESRDKKLIAALKAAIERAITERG
jgi:hypothetical protein